MKVHVSVANPVGSANSCIAQMGEHDEVELAPGQSHVFVVDHDANLSINEGDAVAAAAEAPAEDAEEEGEQA